MPWLLDSNVMIALGAEEHAHHDRCRSWFAGVPAFATCPITEGALVRQLVRLGKTVRDIQAYLSGFAAHAGHDFWADDVSYSGADLSLVTGHKQVTDAYLVNLVRQHPGAKLATLDEGLAQLYPDDVYLIPELPDRPG